MGNRMLRPWVRSEKINSLSVHAERFFTRLIMVVDDHGCYYAHASLLKADMFPLLLDTIREADLLRWIAECEKAGLIVLYEADKKRYLQIQDFRQRLDKARSKFPQPQQVNKEPEFVNEFPAEVENEVEKEKEKEITPKGVSVAGAAGKKIKGYDCEKTIQGLTVFLKTKPDIPEAYQDYWNLFAGKYKLAKAAKLSDTRKRKIKVRIREENFDFVSILSKAAKSPFLLEGKWFGFDWIIENDSNYLKVIEGNYESKETIPAVAAGPSNLAEAVKAIEKNGS